MPIRRTLVKEILLIVVGVPVVLVVGQGAAVVVAVIVIAGAVLMAMLNPGRLVNLYNMIYVLDKYINHIYTNQ